MVRDHDGIDDDSLAPREEDVVPAQEDENEEEDVEENSAEEDEEEPEYDLYRLERLLRLDQRNELPSLDPWSVFRVAVNGRSSITSEDFKLRLARFLKDEDPDFPALSSDLVDFLSNRGINAQRQIAAWDEMDRNAKSPELDKARRYLRQELNRHVKIRSLLAQNRQKAPSWVSAWAQCWVEAFEDIQENIEAQLRSVTEAVDSIGKMRTSHRAEIESHVLWMEKKRIRERIAGTPLARKLEVVLAAFAYAAKLVLPKSGKGTVGYVALIKQRVSRVSRSEGKRTEAMLILLTTNLAMQTGEPRLKPHS